MDQKQIQQMTDMIKTGKSKLIWFCPDCRNTNTEAKKCCPSGLLIIESDSIKRAADGRIIEVRPATLRDIR